MVNAVLVLLSLFSTPHTQVVNLKQAEQVLSVSVLIRAKQYVIDKQTSKIRRGLAGCSGTFVSSTTVLTAAHCFSDPTTDIWVRGPDFKISYRATLLKVDADHDLALLAVQDVTNHPFAPIAAIARAGEQVINVGSPLIFEFLLSEGIVATTQFKHRLFKATYLITTAMINPGSSGGGAFNADGELLGVNTMTIGGFFGWAGISMAVDHVTIREFLK